MARVSLPSGHYADLRDIEDLDSDDLFDISEATDEAHARARSEGQENGWSEAKIESRESRYGVKAMILAVLEDWSYGDTPADLDDVVVPAEDFPALVEAATAVVEALKTNPEEPDPRPGSPT